MIALAGRDALTTFDQLEILMLNWRAIERKLNETGPFIYSTTRTAGLRKIPLD